MNFARDRAVFVIVMFVAACGAGQVAPAPGGPPAGPGPTGPVMTPGLASATPAPSGAAPGLSEVASPVPSGAQAKAPPAASAPAVLSSRSVPFPGGAGASFVDYVAYEPGRERVWVPGGNVGSVDVFDTARGVFARVDGFATAEREMHGKKRTLGPSAVSIGDGAAYIGNRASQEVCAVDLATLKSLGCLKLPMPTDGVAYVASAHEVWVTTPSDQSLTILDASRPAALTVKTTVKTDGEPEGYAVDEARGLFFTNLEDKGGTAVIDVKTRKVKATWNAGCDASGPRGVSFDAAHDFVVIACTDHVQVLDAGHDGARLGRLDTGAGLDNLDVVDATVYAAAGKVARLTVAAIDAAGQLTVVATGETAEGARNAVADKHGNAYLADAKGGRLLVFSAAAR